MTITESALQLSVNVDVDYYSSEHEMRLRKYPTAKQIEGVVASGLKVPVPEFLSYFLFHRVRVAPSRYRSYASVRAAIADAYGMIGDFLVIEDGALHVENDSESLSPYITEYLGESIALAVMNAIHGMSEADWHPIVAQTRPKGAKALDYEYASDGGHIIQIEAKGSVVDDTRSKTNSIYQHKADIEKKKAANIPPSDGMTLQYGAITAIPRSRQNLRCWLLDPEPSVNERTPRDLRVFARLRFLRWIVWLISPRSQLSTALSTRIGALEALRDPFELNSVPLRRPDGEPLVIEFTETRRESYASYFGSRSRVIDGPAGGVVVPLRSNALLFIGFRTELLELGTRQHFERIVEYSAEVGSIHKHVLCIVPAGEFNRFDISERRLPRFSRGSAYVRFELEGQLSYSREGLVFGELPLRVE